MQRLSEDQIEKELNELSGWEYDGESITTAFEFEDFMDCFSVMTRIALEAEKRDHHPAWSNVYNSLEISLSTHDVDGVTQKDIDLAKKIEYIVGDE